MKRIMRNVTLFLSLAFGLCVILDYKTDVDIMKTFSITLGVTLYHFAMRLLVGGVYDRVWNNRVDYKKAWFQVRAFEMGLYKTLRVKHWKKHMPTYETASFDIRKHSLKEIAAATCQAEAVHETIILFSFAPIILGRRFGAWPAFVITSVIAAVIDAAFVMMQRFNRQRLVKLIRE